jgi:hypothetical protein
MGLPLVRAPFVRMRVPLARMRVPLARMRVPLPRICDGRYREAVDFARAGQGFAGRATSASVQLAVQEARAWARCGDKAEVRDAMRRASTALRRLPRPAHPEHHFVFDPAKLVFYMATCSVRVGDADRAEAYAREVIAQSAGPSGVARWPRRLITARMDLGLALTQLNRPDEACYVGSLALASNSLVASNLWQASELDAKLVGEYASLPEAQHSTSSTCRRAAPSQVRPSKRRTSSAGAAAASRMIGSGSSTC